MSYRDSLEITSHWAAILTAVIAVIAYIHFGMGRVRKRWRLEAHLKAEKAKGVDKGQRSLLNLVAELGMTETEIIDAAIRSRCISRRVKPNSQGFAGDLLLEYTDRSN